MNGPCKVKIKDGAVYFTQGENTVLLPYVSDLNFSVDCTENEALHINIGLYLNSIDILTSVARNPLPSGGG